MIEIRRIQPHEWATAKRVIYRVALSVFNDPRHLEESMAYYEARGELKDMDNIEHSYFENGGAFLVMTDHEEIISTGAIRELDEAVCELKRLWLLTEYHGKGLGYRMVEELMTLARQMKYERIRLETDPVSQKRALAFYRQLGFYEIAGYSDRTDEIAMEMIL